MRPLSEILTALPRQYDTVVADAFIVDDRKRVLMQKRSMNRRIFPGFWDAVGGHLEHGESIEACLRREISEETTMELTEILELVHEFEWHAETLAINLQFVCRATGIPVPEEGRVTELRWVDEAEIASLGEWLTPEMQRGARAALDYINRQRT